MADQVPCMKCLGVGRLGLADPYAEVLESLRKYGGTTTGDLAFSFKVEPTAMCNRLEYLRRHGFVTRKKDGRTWIYAAVKRKEGGRG